MVSEVLTEDFQYVASRDLPFEKLHGCSLLITGATGLLGSLLVKTLLYCNRTLALNLQVLAVVRNVEKAQEIFRENMQDKALVLIQQDLRQPFTLTEHRVDYIIHAAAVTASKEMIQSPVDNIQTAVLGTMSVLNLARQKKIKSMVYLSSMEVYGTLNVVDHKITEKEMGIIDLASPRSCYPEGKRICECMCNAYVSQYGMQITSARLAQTFGAGVLKNENRVFAQFAKSAINRENITLRTRGMSEGNYVYTRDAVAAILLLLTKGEAGQAYNVTNEESHMTISEMARLVAAEIADGQIEVVYDIPKDAASTGYAPDVQMHLSAEKLSALGWSPSVGLKEAYMRMIQYMDVEWRKA